ncbi:putative integral membrane protein (TIGR00698 family) [Natronospira proteinivora]|uniref:Integral membrane protein (TIGR00698 family) n=1 Tax=Natronospira proteinivora TaxID=1807133 RepID=A0ABT1GAV9_9GAMM|nr:putative sulfate exporter family transporter [Natronospira proteinivora]MCP1728187.1 putative integral membrane protein (TIGR00698 family) [Natronospira proteinivora]
MRLRLLLPGLIPLLLIALVAFLLPWLQGLGPDALQRLPLSPILLGILMGMALGGVAQRRPDWGPGITLAAGPWLKFAVVLIGLRLSLGELASTGWMALPLVIGVIVTGLLAALLIGRALGIGARLTALLGVGTAICGASAIGATAPAIGARREETAYAVACVAVFGLAATLFYPPLLHWLLGDGHAAGLVLGGAIHDTAQVMGAAALYEQIWPGGGALEAATVSKLMRNAAMLAVIPLVVMMVGAGGSGARRIPRFPLFILGFLAMAGLRSLGDTSVPATWQPGWETLIEAGTQLSQFLFAMAMAALGMGVRPSILRQLGWRPAVLALLTALLVGASALALVTLSL